jgi:hypothetical protein
MKTQLQLILATIGLTILIWVYADQQGYRTMKLTIAVKVAAPKDYVPSIAEEQAPNVRFVSVAARGPNAAFRELNLNRPPPALEVTVSVSDDLTTDVARLVDIHDPVALALRDKGLQLIGLTPSSVSVTFDRWESVKVDIQPDAGAFSATIRSKLDVEPSAVTARVLVSELRNAPTPIENRLVLPIEDQLRAQPGQTDFDFLAPLKDKKWQGLNVNWQPEVIRIRGRLQRQYEDLELKLIPLRVVLPWDWPCDKYQIVWLDERDRLQKVQLKVPVGKPTVLPNLDVTAFIVVDERLIPPEPPSESPGAAATRPAAEPSPYSQVVRFVFPEGFEDVKVVSPPSVVKFRIVKRAQAATAGNGSEPK